MSLVGSGETSKAVESNTDLATFIVEKDLANVDGVPYVLVNHLEKEKPEIANEVLKVKEAKEAEYKASIKAEEERLNGVRLAELEQARIAEEAEQARLSEIEQKFQSEQVKAEEPRRETLQTIKQAEPVENPVQASQPTSSVTSAEFTAYYPVGAGASSAEIAMQGGGITASGHDLKQSIYQNGYKVIAAPPQYSFGTLLRITVGGQSFVGIVSDRGGAIQGNKFDIAVANQGEALAFGRQQGTIEVLN
ncbi:putative 3D domain-containing protein [Carnobacterium phage cd3]|uniref:3D domain-containing protein n=1 Tax=Carnobacterium phage cd2 TaxID=2849244 RepID=A0AAE7SQ78_9CAUD|nr:putative 3D domain-containing protein [Carnobacterium phage cd2]QXP45199.1 putative 3D domain-containing protein [Carnobacterium phage cd2]QXP45246.1 putative 3D domain-containing protein [Carnobacterium phage cd3]